MQIVVHQGTALENAQNLQKLVHSRPFTHQLDVVLTTSEEQALRLAPLQTSYYRTRITFSRLFDFASSSATTALSVGPTATEDAWCLDTRGVLSLSLAKDTYEHLGVGVGAPVVTGSPRHISRFLVTLDLHDTTSPLAVRARESLKQWDIRRAEVGEDGWEVLLSSHNIPSAMCPGIIKMDSKALVQTTPHALIPSRVLPSINAENAPEGLSALFEWVGMACLGSQRLLVNDSVNPYTAFYDPPPGASAGNIFHLRWTGLLSPAFVCSVLEEVVERSEGLRAISGTSFDAPVSYISSSGTTQEGENTWTLVVSDAEVRDRASWETNWVLAETKR